MLIKDFNASTLKTGTRMKKILTNLKRISSKATGNKVEFIYVGDIFDNEDILSDLRDFIFEPIPKLNLLDELDKRGIAFRMRPFSLWFSIYWDKSECKGIDAEGCLTNNTFKNWVKENNTLKNWVKVKD